MNIKLIDLKRQYDLIKEDIFKEYNNIFNSCSFIMGDNVKNFEEEFSKYLGVKHHIHSLLLQKVLLKLELFLFLLMLIRILIILT